MMVKAGLTRTQLIREKDSLEASILGFVNDKLRDFKRKTGVSIIGVAVLFSYKKERVVGVTRVTAIADARDLVGL